jgi:hypothetical protein
MVSVKPLEISRSSIHGILLCDYETTKRSIIDMQSMIGTAAVEAYGADRSAVVSWNFHSRTVDPNGIR